MGMDDGADFVDEGSLFDRLSSLGFNDSPLINSKIIFDNYSSQVEEGVLEKHGDKRGRLNTRISIEITDRYSGLRTEGVEDSDDNKSVKRKKEVHSHQDEELLRLLSLLLDNRDRPGILVLVELYRLRDENLRLREEINSNESKIRELSARLVESRHMLEKSENRATNSEIRAKASESSLADARKCLSDWGEAVDILSGQIAGFFAGVIVLAYLLFFVALIVVALRLALCSQDPNASIASLIGVIVSILLAATPIKWYRSLKHYLSGRVHNFFDKRFL